MKVTTVGLDLAKNLFQLHGADEHGKAVFRKQLCRSKLLEFFAPPCLVGMEASLGRARLRTRTGETWPPDAHHGAALRASLPQEPEE
jgi:transposase